MCTVVIVTLSHATSVLIFYFFYKFLALRRLGMRGAILSLLHTSSLHGAWLSTGYVFMAWCEDIPPLPQYVFMV